MKQPLDRLAALQTKAAATDERETKSCTLQIKAVGDDGSIEGYASVFGILDEWADIVLKGAFSVSIAAHKAAGTMPAMLWQHESDEPIGVWTEMVEDDTGLRVKGKLALDVAKGKEAYALVKMGALSGLSVGFISKEYTYDTTNDVRTLTEVDLWEVSLVTFPANGKARITNVKSVPDQIEAPKDAERILREAGFSKTAATAFVSRVMRMGEDRRDAAKSTAHALQAANRLVELLSLA